VLAETTKAALWSLEQGLRDAHQATAIMREIDWLPGLAYA
jgi:hypothetical protein